MASLELIVGAIGTIALIIAWIWEASENVRQRKIVLHLHFSALYIIGNLLLTAYAWWIGSIIFFILGLFLLAAIVGETIYAIKVGGFSAPLVRRKRGR